MSPLLRKCLRDQQRQLLGWGIGLAGLAVMYAAFYPSIRNNGAALQNYVDRYLPQAFKTLIGGDLTSPAGYLRSETFSTLGPILFLVFAIGAGARAIAGEEEDRTLDLLLSAPVRRRQVLADKWIAMAASALWLAAALDLTNVIVGPLFDLRVSILHLSSICLMLFLLGLAFGTIALAVGSYTGRRATAAGVTGALATFMYVLNVLGPSVDALRPLRPLSPFRWYLEPNPLVNGVSAANLAVFVGIIAVAYAAAWFSFERRDLRA